MTKYNLMVLRKGGVSLDSLRSSISDLGLTERTVVEQLERNHSKPESENLEAPGQFLRHYSPDIVSYLFNGQTEKDISKAIVLDFGSIH